jgi:predicted RNase H-like HicB family nuclease
MKYAVVIEQGESSFGSYVPDLPGCVAVGSSLGEVKRLIRECVEFHLEGLRIEGIALPAAKSICEYMEV